MLGQSPHLIGGILWIQNPMRGMLGGMHSAHSLTGLFFSPAQSFVCACARAGMCGMTPSRACIPTIRFSRSTFYAQPCPRVGGPEPVSPVFFGLSEDVEL